MFLQGISFYPNEDSYKKNGIKEQCEKSFENKLFVTLYTITKELSLVLQNIRK